MGFKMTIISEVPIEGWDCTWREIGSGGGEYVCSPSDEYIRTRAYYRWLTESPPGGTPFSNWITAEEDFIAAKGNNLPWLT